MPPPDTDDVARLDVGVDVMLLLVTTKRASFRVSCGPIPIRQFGELDALLWIRSAEVVAP